MATLALVPVDDYLRSSFDGLDREFVNGVVIERSMPTYLHSKVQAMLCALFIELGRRLAIFPAPELRLALIPGRVYRLPDVCVFAGREPVEPVPSEPPLVTIEILSPDDRMGEMLGKLEEYRQFGVAHIWVIDPDARQFYVFDGAGLHPVGQLELPEYEFVVRRGDLGIG